MSVEVHNVGAAPVRPEFEIEPSEAVTIGDVERPLSLAERIVHNESFQRLAILVALIVVWELYARWLHNSLLFPTFTETVQTFWLYRAAELTLQHGYAGFQVLPGVKLVRDVPGFVPAQYVEKPYLVGRIHLLKGPIKPNPPLVFDAEVLLRTLDAYVKGPMCQQNVCPHAHTYLMPPLS